MVDNRVSEAKRDGIAEMFGPKLAPTRGIDRDMNALRNIQIRRKQS